MVPTYVFDIMGGGKNHKKTPNSGSKNDNGKRIRISPTTPVFSTPNMSDILDNTPSKQVEKKSKRLNLDIGTPTTSCNENEEITETQNMADSIIREDNEICICTKIVKDEQDAIECESCRHWYHIRCIKIKKEYLNMIQNLGDIIKWYCDGCKSKIEMMIESDKVLKFENNELKKKNHMINMKIEQLEKSIEVLEISINENLSNLKEIKNKDNLDQDEIMNKIEKNSKELKVEFKGVIKEACEKISTELDKKMQDGNEMHYSLSAMFTTMETNMKEMENNLKQDITEYVEGNISKTLERNQYSTSPGKQEMENFRKDNLELRYKINQIEKKFQKHPQDVENLNSDNIDKREELQNKIETKIKEGLLKTMKYEEDRKDREKKLNYFQYGRIHAKQWI